MKSDFTDFLLGDEILPLQNNSLARSLPEGCVAP
jgi:hypothetical protein